MKQGLDIPIFHTDSKTQKISDIRMSKNMITL